MAVKVDRDLDRAVSKLVPHIGEAGTRLNEQGSVGMPQIMNPKVSESGFPDGGKEIPSIHVPTVQWGSSFGMPANNDELPASNSRSWNEHGCEPPAA